MSWEQSRRHEYDADGNQTLQVVSFASTTSLYYGEGNLIKKTDLDDIIGTESSRHPCQPGM